VSAGVGSSIVTLYYSLAPRLAPNLRPLWWPTDAEPDRIQGRSVRTKYVHKTLCASSSFPFPFGGPS
jgi:hypothetical protein